jgi:hypothetical protein
LTPRLDPLKLSTLFSYTHYDTVARRHVRRLTWRDLGFYQPVEDNYRLTAAKMHTHDRSCKKCHPGILSKVRKFLGV